MVAAFLVSPYFLGSRAQEQFHDKIVTFNKTSPYSSFVTIIPESYQRHWFSSDAQIKVIFHTPANGAYQNVDKSFTYKATIKHGPLFFITKNGKASIHLGPGAIIIRGDTPEFNGLIAISLNWNNQLNIDANIPTLALKDSQNNSFTFHNLKFTTQPSANNNEKYTLLLPNFVAQINTASPAGIITIDNTKLTVNGHDDQGAWLGTNDFTIDTITANIKENGVEIPIVYMKNIAANMDINPTDDKTKLNSLLNFNIESLTAAGKTIKPITLSYEIDGVNAAAYRQLITSINKVQAITKMPSLPDMMSAVDATLKIIESGLILKVNKIYVGLPKNLASSPLSANAQLIIKPSATDLSQEITPITSAITPTSAKPGQQYLQNSITINMNKLISPLLNRLTHSITASGHALIPESLVKQVLLKRYTEILMRMAARGKNVTQTPQDLANDAYDYLTSHNMLIANHDGSMKVHATFTNGDLLINGEKPALDLPNPGNQTTQSLSTITPEHTASP